LLAKNKPEDPQLTLTKKYKTLRESSLALSNFEGDRKMKDMEIYRKEDDLETRKKELAEFSAKTQTRLALVTNAIDDLESKISGNRKAVEKSQGELISLAASLENKLKEKEDEVTKLERLVKSRGFVEDLYVQTNQNEDFPKLENLKNFINRLDQFNRLHHEENEIRKPRLTQEYLDLKTKLAAAPSEINVKQRKLEVMQDKLEKVKEEIANIQKIKDLEKAAVEDEIVQKTKTEFFYKTSLESIFKSLIASCKYSSRKKQLAKKENAPVEEFLPDLAERISEVSAILKEFKAVSSDKSATKINAGLPGGKRNSKLLSESLGLVQFVTPSGNVSLKSSQGNSLKTFSSKSVTSSLNSK
jgi:chromosome segregation ATPase